LNKALAGGIDWYSASRDRTSCLHILLDRVAREQLKLLEKSLRIDPAPPARGSTQLREFVRGPSPGN